MEQHQDAHIVCGDCGASFLFSAAEAALFTERGLAAPKRCKNCRRARKERSGQDATNGVRRAPAGGEGHGNVHTDSRAGYASRERGQPSRRNARPGPVRYTGDVNEYRSPMQTTTYGSASWSNAILAPSRGRRPEGRQAQNDGNYRAPSGSVARARFDGGARDSVSTSSRPAPEMFPITCNGCGADAAVPFKPAEGREVFCQACYRARKPA